MDAIKIPLEIYRRENLKFYTTDTRITLWTTANRSEIFVYASGTRVGAEAVIGLIPHQHLNLILPLADDKHCMARIVLLTDCACSIEVWLDSDNTTEKEIKQQYDSLIEKISAKYSPKKEFETDIQLPKDHNIQIGQGLRVKSKNPGYFIDYIF